MKTTWLEFLLRIALICVLLVASGDFYFRFVEHPEPSRRAQEFLISLTAAGYVWKGLATFLLLCALLLFFRRFVGLALALLFPVTLNVILYHAFLDPDWGNARGAMLLTLLHLGLAICHRRAFRSLVNLS